MVVLAIVVAIHLMGAWYWPDTLAFANRDMVAAKGQFITWPESARALVERARVLLLHLMIYPYAPPAPALVMDRFGVISLTFMTSAIQPDTFSTISAVCWGGFLAAGFLRWRAAWSRWGGLASGILLSLLFHFALHLVYGDDFFLYTSHWIALLIALAALPFAAVPPLYWRAGMLASLAITAAAGYRLHADLIAALGPEANRFWARYLPREHVRAMEVAELSRKAGVNTLYVSTRERWLAYPLASQGICVAGLPIENRTDMRACAERAVDKIGVLNQASNLSDFVRTTGGSLEMYRLGDWTITANFQPPKTGLRAIDPSLIARIFDQDGVDQREKLIDGDVHSGWPLPFNQTNTFLEIEFTVPVNLHAVRLLIARGRPTIEIEAWGRAPGDNRWVPLGGVHSNRGYQWSGPRIFFGGISRRIEARFTAGSLRAFRLVFYSHDSSAALEIAALQLYEEAEQPESTNAVSEVLAILDRYKVHTAYAERFLATAIDTARSGRIAVNTEPGIFSAPRARRLPQPQIRPQYVLMRGTTAFITRSEDAAFSRRKIERLGIAMTEVSAGPWATFIVSGPDRLAELSLVWAGDNLLFDSDVRPPSINADDAKPLVRFDRWGTLGKLMDVRVTPHQLAPGGRGRVHLEWMFPAPPPDKRPGVFMHFFCGASLIFQADHSLMEGWSGKDIDGYPPGTRFRQTVTFQIPTDAPEGPYELWAGLWWPDRKKRVTPITDLAVRSKAVQIPITLRVAQTPRGASSKEEHDKTEAEHLPLPAPAPDSA